MKRAIVLLSALQWSACLFSSGESNFENTSDLGTPDASTADADPGDSGGADGSMYVDVEVPENCGDGLLQPEETCDPMLPASSPGACPTECDDGEVCTEDSIVGLAATCNAACQSAVIEVCRNGDGCCPGDCDATNDTDCDTSSVCGDAVVSGGELCDAGIDLFADGGCPKTEDCAPMICATAQVIGSRSNCNAACDYVDITVCRPGDNCCPTGCDATSDPDCAITCGDGVIDGGELCDGNCPDACDDGNACTSDTLVGDAMTCDARCVFTPIAACLDGDACCPASCSTMSDDDCSASCGDNVLDVGETCDGPSNPCPTTCNDANACTVDNTTGSPANCNVACTNTPRTGCTNDGCCVAGCNANNDPDCMPVCGNNAVETGEVCDGNCPATCDDNNVCTTNTLTGTGCNRRCTFAAITMCVPGDGCCPTGCNNNNDSDCGAVCGNSVVEVGETCDGNCPASCDDGNACTNDIPSGSASMCTRTCVHTTKTSCVNNDGCCPAGCNASNDNNCSATCGNGMVEPPGETCDGNCPSSCGVCATLSGSAGQCNATCTPIPGCVPCTLGGSCPCSVDQACVAGKCESSSGSNCKNSCDPSLYCGYWSGFEGCNTVANQCYECEQSYDCWNPVDQCVSGNCTMATNCTQASDPDQFCWITQGLNACDFQTLQCTDGCTSAGDCNLNEMCMGGFCVPATTCNLAHDPNYFCGTNQVCIGTSCYPECYDTGSEGACDCPFPTDQECLFDLATSQHYCDYTQFAYCWQVCSNNRDQYCVNMFGPGSYCDSNSQQSNGCSSLGGDDMDMDLGGDGGSDDADIGDGGSGDMSMDP